MGALADILGHLFAIAAVVIFLVLLVGTMG